MVERECEQTTSTELHEPPTLNPPAVRGLALGLTRSLVGISRDPPPRPRALSRRRRPYQGTALLPCEATAANVAGKDLHAMEGPGQVFP